MAQYSKSLENAMPGNSTSDSGTPGLPGQSHSKGRESEARDPNASSDSGHDVKDAPKRKVLPRTRLFIDADEVEELAADERKNVGADAQGDHASDALGKDAAAGPDIKPAKPPAN